ncbi:chemotaxis protein CheW [Chromobacterium haemolyticum]|uniref:chemotaxis protein CheW n=1 Tax=Chromobacterium haemolyticum TaxID=394935 RepID=UPI0009D9F11B|nr:chemotaxis protein CheW [Chromobacterium haemolyticum]OQS33850.1 chemotaxis protein CheW [Chromobacterium haemolyticum]
MSEKLHREMLVFRLGDEEYGIDILKVQEIRGCDPVTKIANSPEFVRGVINLRGHIVPIVDLRVKFGIGQLSYDDMTVVIILNVLGRTMGIVVDGVSDVVIFDPDNVRKAPDLGAIIDAAFIDGLGILEQRMVILLDIEGMTSSEGFLTISTESGPDAGEVG